MAQQAHDSSTARVSSLHVAGERKQLRHTTWSGRFRQAGGGLQETECKEGKRERGTGGQGMAWWEGAILTFSTTGSLSV